MSAKIRTVLLVSLVTVLIWLWAEGESLSTTSLNPSIVFLHDNDELLRVETDDDWRGMVRVRLQGSTRALTQAESKLGSQLSLRLGQNGVPGQPGQKQVVRLEEAIRQMPEIRAAGLSVQEVTPASTVVNIVRLVEQELPVRAVLPAGVETLADPVCSPLRVSVRMPEELAKQLSPDATAVATITREEMGTGRDDASQTLVTTVQLPGPLAEAAGVTIKPEKVSVTFRLKRSVDSVTLASSPVWFALPPVEGNKWNIELTDQFLRDVTFTGPAEAIARIRSGEVVPIAEVRLSSDDLEKGIETKEALFVGLPPGVESGVAVKTVRLRITRRKAEPPEGPSNLSSPEPAPASEVDPG
jgi:hypothetical protein